MVYRQKLKDFSDLVNIQRQTDLSKSKPLPGWPDPPPIPFYGPSIIKMKEPRYDDVYYNGLKWLNNL